MKKKLLLLSLLLITLLFMGCDQSTSISKMTITNDSSETITNIEVRYNAYLAATSKMASYENSLTDGQFVEQNESVEYDLLPIVSDPINEFSTIRVRISTTHEGDEGTEYEYEDVYIRIENDAVFTLHYKGYDNDDDSKFTIAGTGATFPSVV